MFVNDHLRGVRNGKRTGRRLNIAANAAERINEKHQLDISASII